VPGSPPPPCSIALWRGYVAGQFYLREPEGGAALALSPTFRIWRFPWQERKPLDEDADALAALAALRADLISEGWERMRRASGSEWYELRFRWHGSDHHPGSSGRPNARPRGSAAPPRTRALKAAAADGEDARITQWVAQTPDGNELRVRRAADTWIVSCGQDEARSDLLDVAMIEAIRGDAAVSAHSPSVEYGPWIRAQADRIERAFRATPEQIDP